MREKSFIQLIEKPLDFSHLFVAVYIDNGFPAGPTGLLTHPSVRITVLFGTLIPKV